jgi:SSS family transporter
MHYHFSTLDWLVLAAYVAAVTMIGSLFYHKGASAADFFLGGRTMKAIPVAISLVAADMSAITYMGTPAWSFQFNLEMFWVTLSYVVAVPVVMYLFLPFYMRLKLYTGYEYLERRFDMKTRLMASGLFLLMRGSHVAIAIYAPSIILSLLTGLPLYISVLVMGIFTTLYTTLGGMKAVIWTDVMQFSILMSGMIVVFWLALSRIPGGLHTVYSVAGHAGRLHFLNFSFDPDQLTAFWPAILGGGAMALSTLGTDQAYLQRYFSTKSLKEGQRSVMMDALIVIPVSLLLYLLGCVLFVFYHFHPAHLKGLPVKDAVLPFFVLRELGGVFSGLVIASIFASSMAVMSAGINALTTATTVDFYKRWLQPGRKDSHYVRAGRIGTIGWGALCTLGALYANRLGPLINAFNKINAFLGGPLLGIFLLGMLSKRAKGTPSVIGGVVALAIVSVLNWATNISFFYHAIIGVTITFAVGHLLSYWGPSPSYEKIAGLVRGIGAPAERNSAAATVPPSGR